MQTLGKLLASLFAAAAIPVGMRSRTMKRRFSGERLREMRAKNGVGRPPRLKAYTHPCRVIP